jgi:hypothetical protein
VSNLESLYAVLAGASTSSITCFSNLPQIPKNKCNPFHLPHNSSAQRYTVFPIQPASSALAQVTPRCPLSHTIPSLHPVTPSRHTLRISFPQSLGFLMPTTTWCLRLRVQSLNPILFKNYLTHCFSFVAGKWQFNDKLQKEQHASHNQRFFYSTLR